MKNIIPAAELGSVDPLGSQRINLPAALLLTQGSLENLSALGLSIVIARFEVTGHLSPLFKCGSFWEELGQELKAAGCGEYAETFWQHDEHWHCYQVNDLAAAIRTLIAGIERRELQRLAAIYSAEDADTLLIWYPASKAGQKITG